MTEAERIAADAKAKADAEAKARADAEAGEKLDKLLTGIDSLHKRLDSSDKRIDEYCAKVDSMSKKDDDDDDDAKKKDDDDDDEDIKAKEEPKEIVADKKKRKDAEEKEEKKEKPAFLADKKKRKDAEEKEKDDDDDDDDSKRKDSVELTKLRADLIEVRSRLPLDQAHPDYMKLLDAQAKADDVFRAFGDSAPRPLNGESLINYRTRVASKLQVHSARWKPVELNKLAEPAFIVAESQIYSDAMAVAGDPMTVADGGLRMIPGKTQAGHVMNTFVGHPSSWMNEFGGQRRAVTDIVVHKSL